MDVSLIVAAGQNGVIGQKGRIPWRLPADLALFKQLTMGHPVIMGRKTHESIGRPLPGRQNIVISRDQNYAAAGCEVVHSLGEALRRAEPAPEVFIIGGAQIYKAAMPLADKLYLTEVRASVDGDAFFKYDPGEWRLEQSRHHPADEQNQYAFTIKRLVRKSAVK